MKEETQDLVVYSINGYLIIKSAFLIIISFYNVFKLLGLPYSQVNNNIINLFLFLIIFSSLLLLFCIHSIRIYKIKKRLKRLEKLKFKHKKRA